MAKSEISWEDERRSSADIPDFVRKLTKGTQELPRARRGEAYRQVLLDIDPDLEQHVRILANLKIINGKPPAQALAEATKKGLIERRLRLFRYLFGTFAPQRAEQAVAELMTFTDNVEYRAQLYDRMVRILRPFLPLAYREEDARYRLKELPFEPWFNEWLLQNPRMSESDIKRFVAEKIKKGMEPRQAMVAGLTRAIREYAIEYVMSSSGVAHGPDFCGAAAAAIIGGAIAVGTAAYSIASSSAANAEGRRGLYRDRRSSLNEEELREAAALTARYSDWTRVYPLFIEYLAGKKAGRTWLVGDELNRFRTLWNEARQLVLTEDAALRQAERVRTTERQAATAAGVQVERVQQFEQAVAAQELAARRVTAPRRWSKILGVAVVGVGLAGVVVSLVRSNRSK